MLAMIESLNHDHPHRYDHFVLSDITLLGLRFEASLIEECNDLYEAFGGPKGYYFSVQSDDEFDELIFMFGELELTFNKGFDPETELVLAAMHAVLRKVFGATRLQFTDRHKNVLRRCHDGHIVPRFLIAA